MICRTKIDEAKDRVIEAARDLVDDMNEYEGDENPWAFTRVLEEALVDLDQIEARTQCFEAASPLPGSGEFKCP